MIIGMFNFWYFFWIILAAGGVAGLYFALRRASRKTQAVVLGALSFSGIVAIIYNLVTWGSPIEYLPLHLCSINAILLPIVVFTRNKTLGNLLLSGAWAHWPLWSSIWRRQNTSWQAGPL